MLNPLTVFIEHRYDSRYICHRATLFSQYHHSICHLLTCLTKDVGHTGLPKDMSNRVYNAAKKTAGDSVLWFWFTLQELKDYCRSVPARQMEALLLQQNCMHRHIKEQVQDIITCSINPNKDPEDIRLISWIEREWP